MALMMEFMKGMQKRMNEGKEETGVVRGVETIRSGSPDLPLLAAWEPQQGPLILGDWLLLVEPIVADLSLSAAEWWKALIDASEQWYKRHVSVSPLGHQASRGSSCRKSTRKIAKIGTPSGFHDAPSCSSTST